jgi:hypothetical protein
MAAAATHPTRQESSDQKAAGTACRTVLTITELTERVVVHLPINDIFVIQQVCKTFENVIDASPSIREKIFKRLRGRLVVPVPVSAASLTNDQQVSRLEARDPSELASKAKQRSVLHPSLAILPYTRFGNSVPGGKVPDLSGVKVQFKKLHSFHWRTHTDEHDSCLDTYFCDLPCRNITVRQQYIVKREVLENTVDIQMEKVATVHEVLTTALTQASWISGIRFIDPADRPMSMEAALKLREQANGCENRSQTVFSKAVFTLHRVLDPVSSG